MFRSLSIALACVLVSHLPVSQAAHNQPAQQSPLKPFGPTSERVASATSPSLPKQHGAFAASARSRTAPAYAQLPLSFEPNRGQRGASVLFSARTPAYNVAVTAVGVEL